MNILNKIVSGSVVRINSILAWVAVALIGSGKINVKPLITDRYKFEDGIAAFEYASRPGPDTVKVMINF